jgi:hypothetical protein
VRVLSAFQAGDRVYGIAEEKHYYIVFEVCEEHAGIFRSTRDFRCASFAISEEDAVIGTLFPERTVGIFSKYFEMKEKLEKLLNYLFFKKGVRFSSETREYFEKLGYIEQQILNFVKSCELPYDVDYTKPFATTIVAKSEIYRKLVEIAEHWRFEFDGEQFRLAPCKP